MKRDVAGAVPSIGIGTVVVLLIFIGFLVGAVGGSSLGLFMIGLGLLIAPFAMFWVGAKALKEGRTVAGIFLIIVGFVLFGAFVLVGFAFILAGLGGAAA